MTFFCFLLFLLALRQNDELEDLYSFTLSADKSSDSRSFCLDHLGDEFSKCYTIYMDDLGYNPQQVSWSVKISTKNLGADWRTCVNQPYLAVPAHLASENIKSRATTC